MAYKIYFDINVLLDLTLQRSNFNEVELIMNEIQNGFKKGFLTGATIHTLSYFLSKRYDQKKVKELLECKCKECKECVGMLAEVTNVYLLMQGMQVNIAGCVQTTSLYIKTADQYAKAVSICGVENCNCNC